MNSLTRFRDDLMKEFFTDWASPSFVVRPLHGRPLPEDFAVDIREGEQAYTLQAEMPGLKKEDIKVDIDGPRVTIGAEVKQLDEKVEGDRVVRSERFFGAVSRTFHLASEIDSAAASAAYHDGILTLTLPKKSGAVGKRIAVH